MPTQPIDLTGKQFHRLVVIRRGPDKRFRGTSRPRVQWECRCSCGSTILVPTWHLNNNHTKSCGCYKAEVVSVAAAVANTTHGESHDHITPEYRSWQAMLLRCNNPASKDFHRYGAIGVSVCQRWQNSYEAFLQDMGRRPSLRYSIDRFPNNNGNYEPGNCRWADSIQQSRNRRNTIILTLDGVAKTIPEWAEDLGISYEIIIGRIRRGWTVEEALRTPHKQRVPRRRL